MQHKDRDLVLNNDDDENFSIASPQNEPKALYNGNLQCTIIITTNTTFKIKERNVT